MSNITLLYVSRRPVCVRAGLKAADWTPSFVVWKQADQPHHQFCNVCCCKIWKTIKSMILIWTVQKAMQIIWLPWWSISIWVWGFFLIYLLWTVSPWKIVWHSDPTVILLEYSWTMCFGAVFTVYLLWRTTELLNAVLKITTAEYLCIKSSDMHPDLKYSLIHSCFSTKNWFLMVSLGLILVKCCLGLFLFVWSILTEQPTCIYSKFVFVVLF